MKTFASKSQMSYGHFSQLTQVFIDTVHKITTRYATLKIENGTIPMYSVAKNQKTGQVGNPLASEKFLCMSYSLL